MRAYLVPIGVVDGSPLAFLQRKDHGLGPELCDRVLAIGGAVEAGETPDAAVRRELEEEVPGWWQETMGERAPGRLERLFEDDAIVVFTAPVRADARVTRSYIQRTAEGVPALLTRPAVERLGDAHWVYPQLRAALLRHMTG